VFVSTHFMNEAERCDRISLMHAGRVLAVGAPDELRRSKNAASLDDAFVTFLEDAVAEEPAMAPPPNAKAWYHEKASGSIGADGLGASARRIWAFAYREMRELMRDRVRIGFALLGPLILLVTFGFGITFDVENLSFAVLDRDQSIDSRQLIESFSGSRYFRERPVLRSEAEIDRRLRGGELRLAISIPPGFGRDLLTGRKPEVAFFLDGATPFRAETTRNYAEGIVLSYVRDLARRRFGDVPILVDVSVEPRFRYNQDFRSAFALTPGLIMIFMVMFSSMLAALGVVREREIGSITNLYASPASVAEYLIGKQAPYIAVGFTSLLSLIVLAALVFGVTVKGSMAALALGGLLYIFAATALGILISTFVRTQVAAIIVTAIVATVPAINFSGYLYPVAGLDSTGRIIGMSFPSLWFQNIALGTFTKAREFAAFYPEFLVLLAFGCAYLAAASLLLRKQET
jgi:ribosome-dependent ATPase